MGSTKIALGLGTWMCASVLAGATALAQPSLDSLGAEPADAAAPEAVEEEVVDEEEYVEMEGDFCGGGEETDVDLAYYEIESGNYREARTLLQTALHDRTIEDWQRPQAFAMLGEVQLRLGAVRAAERNYRRALSIDEESAGAASRVGLAVAMLRAGRTDAAREEARTFAEEQCFDVNADTVACYGAYEVISRASSDGFAMLDAMHQAFALRLGAPDFEEAFDRMLDAVDPPTPAAGVAALSPRS
jgi:tetratricopeptide (TPR) repeat protein